MARVRSDNDARYALRASFVDENGDVITGDTITIGGGTDSRISNTQISNWDTAYSNFGLLNSKLTTSSNTIGDSYGINAHYMSGADPNKPTGTDHSLLTLSYSADWQTQIAQDWREGGRTFVRGQNNGTWSSWSQLWSSEDFIVDSSGNVTFTGTVSSPNAVFTGGGDNIRIEDSNPQIKWETTTAGDTDYWWHLGATGIFYCLADRTGDGSWETPYPIQMDAASNYINFYGTAQIKPLIGEYGSFHIDAAGNNGYEGFSIGGRAVFMHNNANTTGLYNDVNNQWILKATHNAETNIYHAGQIRGYTYASGWRVTGNLLATGDVYAYYSDRRLKAIEGAIESPLEKVSALHGVYYTHNEKARQLGYEGSERQVGLIAQEVQAVLPEVIGRAPVDDDGEGGSVTGENYITVNYQRIVPLLVEAIKELKAEVEELKNGGNK